MSGDTCKRTHTQPVIDAVANQPWHPKHTMVMPRCAACSYEEGFVKGIEVATNQMLTIARELRARHDQEYANATTALTRAEDQA